MRRRLPPYVYRECTRHGRWILYFRRGKGKRIRLPEDPSSPGFGAAYRAALTGDAPQERGEPVSPRSLRWLVDRYRESAVWRQLAPGTRKQREPIFLATSERAGNPPFAATSRADVQRAMDERADTPAAANSFLETMRGLFDWAGRNGHVDRDPTAGVRKLRYRSDGFPAWTPEDVQAFRACHPAGTPARLLTSLWRSTDGSGWSRPRSTRAEPTGRAWECRLRRSWRAKSRTTFPAPPIRTPCT